MGLWYEFSLVVLLAAENAFCVSWRLCSFYEQSRPLRKAAFIHYHVMVYASFFLLLLLLKLCVLPSFVIGGDNFQSILKPLYKTSKHVDSRCCVSVVVFLLSSLFILGV